jgi:hypothetical protein
VVRRLLHRKSLKTISQENNVPLQRLKIVARQGFDECAASMGAMRVMPKPSYMLK